MRMRPVCPSQAAARTRAMIGTGTITAGM